MSNLKIATILNRLGTKSVPVDTVIDGSAKAWVNFNGTGVVAIRAAFNVSSITDHGPGEFTANFAAQMPDANYVSAYSWTLVAALSALDVISQAAAGVRVACRGKNNVSYDGAVLVDLPLIGITVFR